MELVGDSAMDWDADADRGWDGDGDGDETGDGDGDGDGTGTGDGDGTEERHRDGWYFGGFLSLVLVSLRRILSMSFDSSRVGDGHVQSPRN